jgi:hypothetical protein
MSTASERPSPYSARRSDRAPYMAWALRGCGALFLGGSAFAQALVNGGVVSGTISAPGERDTYTFVAQDRQRFELRLVRVNASSWTPQLELYNPRGVLIQTSSSPDVAVIDTTQVLARLGSVTPPGTFTVVVANASAARIQTGAYDLHFVLAPGANAGGLLLDGLTVFGEIERGDLDSFTFATAAWQTVKGTITTLHGGTLRLRFEEFDVNGGYSEGIGGTTVNFSRTQSPGSIHTIVLSDGSSTAAGTGRYSILVRGVPDAPPYPPSVFWPSEYWSDPLLLDNAGIPGLGPRIGDPLEPFNVSIDCTAADAPGLYALSLSAGQQSAASTPWGWLYLDGPRLLWKFGSHTRSVEAWFPEPTGLPLPHDLSLVGLNYTVQGRCGGFGGSNRLSGAITQTIGD